MSYTYNHDYTIQQVGWGQGADINTSIHDHLLRKAVFTQGVEKYQPTRSRTAPTKGIARIFQGLFSSLLLS
jgi:hypothetical protein